jgi:hypothetical protein
MNFVNIADTFPLLFSFQLCQSKKYPYLHERRVVAFTVI